MSPQEPSKTKLNKAFHRKSNNCLPILEELFDANIVDCTFIRTRYETETSTFL